VKGKGQKRRARQKLDDFQPHVLVSLLHVGALSAAATSLILFPVRPGRFG